MLRYRTNLLEELEDRGFTQFRLKKDKILGSSTIDKLREGKMIGINALEKICDLLDMQPGDLIENRKEDEKNAKN